MFKIYIFFLTLLIKHPIYLSHTEIDFNDKENKVELSLKIFIDDIEKYILKSNNNKLIDVEYIKENKIDLLNYIEDNLIIKINKKTKILENVDIVLENDDFNSLYLLYVINNVKRINLLEVSNTILFESISNQKNYVSFRKDNDGYKKNVCYINNKNISFE